MTWSCIEITSGVVSAPVHTQYGNLTELEFENIGHRMFFVEAIEADGGRIVLHGGLSYAAAIVVADEAASAEGIEVCAFQTEAR